MPDPRRDDGLHRLFQTVDITSMTSTRSGRVADVCAALEEAAQVIAYICPASADRTLAIQHLVDAKHRALDAILFRGDRLIPMS